MSFKPGIAQGPTHSQTIWALDLATIAMVRDCQSNTLVTPRFVDMHIALYIFIRYTTFPAGVNHAFGHSGQLFPDRAAKLLTVKSIEG